MQISVKQLDGTKRDYNVEETMKIGDLKEEIGEATGVPVDAMRLIFGGKMQEDEMTIAECTIKAGGCINMVMNL